jgi:hypothetical protein
MKGSQGTEHVIVAGASGMCVMSRGRSSRLLGLCAALALLPAARVRAQVGYGTVPGSGPVPYGYSINNGLIGPGYRAAHRLNSQVYGATVLRGPQTVTDYQSLINAITSLPGWYGPPAHPARPVPPRPAVPRGELYRDDGTVLWPAATPDGPAVAQARRAAEEAVRGVVEENRKYSRASVRRVADARNKLTDFARLALPGLKARSAADADALERFIVELKKALATLAVNY